MSQSTAEEKAAMEMAQALLGSMAQQPPELPPPVQANPAAAQQAQPAAQVPTDNVVEIKEDDPPLTVTSEQKVQSTDSSPPVIDYYNVFCARYQSRLQHSSLR